MLFRIAAVAAGLLLQQIAGSAIVVADAAVVAAATSSVEARSSDYYGGALRQGGRCVVICDSPNERNEFQLSLGPCDSDAVNFYYDGERRISYDSIFIRIQYVHT